MAADPRCCADTELGVDVNWIATNTQGSVLPRDQNQWSQHALRQNCFSLAPFSSEAISKGLHISCFARGPFHPLQLLQEWHKLISILSIRKFWKAFSSGSLNFWKKNLSGACAISYSCWVKLHWIPGAACLLQTFYISYVTISRINGLFLFLSSLFHFCLQTAAVLVSSLRVDFYLISSVSVRWHIVRSALEIIFLSLSACRSFKSLPTSLCQNAPIKRKGNIPEGGTGWEQGIGENKERGKVSDRTTWCLLARHLPHKASNWFYSSHEINKTLSLCPPSKLFQQRTENRA